MGVRRAQRLRSRVASVRCANNKATQTLRCTDSMRRAGSCRYATVSLYQGCLAQIIAQRLRDRSDICFVRERVFCVYNAQSRRGACTAQFRTRISHTRMHACSTSGAVACMQTSQGFCAVHSVSRSMVHRASQKPIHHLRRGWKAHSHQSPTG